MKRAKKLILTVAALAALAVGGAAFAQAQNSGSTSTAPKQSAAPAKASESGTPADPADAPSPEDQQDETSTPGDPVDAPSAEDQEQSERGEANDHPDGPNDDHGADDVAESGA